MSAYIVDDETINRVVSHIYLEIHGNTILGGQYKQLLKDYPLHSDVGYVKLAEDMFKLNIAGVEARYGEGEAKEFRPLDFSYRFEVPGNKYQALKSLQCWHYQCCEGGIPETNSLYKIFEGIESSLEHELVRAMPEYDKAVWG